MDRSREKRGESSYRASHSPLHKRPKTDQYYSGSTELSVKASPSRRVVWAPSSSLVRSTPVYKPLTELNRNRESPNINNNTDTEQALHQFLKSSLTELGLGEQLAVPEVGKMVKSLRKVVHKIDGGSVAVGQLTNLLQGAGYSSDHLAPSLAAKLCIDFLAKDTEGGPKKGGEKFPPMVMQVEDGYPRLALGIAFHLHNHSGYSELVSKSLAKSMVEVWIKYDVPFRKLRRVCTKRPEEQSREYLRSLLERKVNGDQNQKNERSRQFNSLIEMTVKFFSIALNQ